MSLGVRISDGRGLKTPVGVTVDNALLTTVVPPSNARDLSDDQLTRQKQYGSYLVDAAGSFDMNVDGSVTPVEFSTTQLLDQVAYITEIRLIFHDTQLNMDSNEARRFGSAAGLAGLTNGITGSVTQAGQTFPLSLEPVRHMGEFFTYNDGIRNVVDGIAAGTDLLVWIFVIDPAIALPEGTLDKLTVTVNDDLSTMTLFRTAVFGWREAR